MAEWGRGSVQGMVWSPDGKRLAVSTPFGVYLYPADTLASPILIRSSASAYHLAWSQDGARLAVDTGDAGGDAQLSAPVHRIQIWDVSTAEPAPVALFDVGGMVLDFAFSSSNGAGELVVLSRVADGALFQRWDIQGLKVTQSVPFRDTGMVEDGTLAPDFATAATHTKAGVVRIWRTRDGAQLSTTPALDSNPGVLAFSPDGSLLAVGYPDETQDYLNVNRVRIWQIPADGGDLKEPAYTFWDPVHTEGTEEKVVSLAWSKDGQFIASGTSDQVLHVYQLKAGPVYRRIPMESLPRYLAFSPDHGDTLPRIAAGELEIYRIEDGQRTAYDDGYLPGLYDMRFTPDDSALALSEFGKIDFRSTYDGTRKQVIKGMDGAVNSIAFDPVEQFLAAACQDGQTRLFRVMDGAFWNTLGEPTLPVLSADISSNNFWIASSGEDMKIRIFRMDDAALIETIQEPYVAYKVLFAPNNNQLATLTTNGVNLRIVNGTERKTNMVLEGTVGGVGLTDMAYSPGSEFLALVGNDVVRVIDPVSRTDVYSIHEPSGAMPWSVAFSPDNAFLAVGWSNGQISIYWAQDGTFMRTWQAHPQSVLRLAFSKDRQRLASLGSEATIRIWGVAP